MAGKSQVGLITLYYYYYYYGFISFSSASKSNQYTSSLHNNNALAQQMKYSCYYFHLLWQVIISVPTALSFIVSLHSLNLNKWRGRTHYGCADRWIVPYYTAPIILLIPLLFDTILTIFKRLTYTSNYIMKAKTELNYCKSFFLWDWFTWIAEGGNKQQWQHWIQQYTSLWTNYSLPVIVYSGGTGSLWLVSSMCRVQTIAKLAHCILAAAEIIPAPTHLPLNVTILHHPNIFLLLLSAGTAELLLKRCVTSCRIQCNRNLKHTGSFCSSGDAFNCNAFWLIWDVCGFPLNWGGNDGLTFHLVQTRIRHEKLRQSLCFWQRGRRT